MDDNGTAHTVTGAGNITGNTDRRKEECRRFTDGLVRGQGRRQKSEKTHDQVYIAFILFLFFP